MSLDQAVCAKWAAFKQGGKERITIGQLLSHRAAGVRATMMPKRAKLEQLLALPAMEAHVAAASVPAPSDVPSHGLGAFEGAPWGWVLSGLLRASCGGADVHALLEERLCAPLGLGGELRLRARPEEASTVARHSIAALMQELGVDMANLQGFAGSDSPPDDPTVAAPSSAAASSSGAAKGTAKGAAKDPFASSAESIDWERFQGPAQLQMPATYNASIVREAGVPGSAMLGSARALANFYVALVRAGGSGRRLLESDALRRRLAAEPKQGSLDDEPVIWGLGVQVGSIAKRDEASGGGGTTTIIGHRGQGGTVGFVLPEADLAVAVTLSQLSLKRDVTRRLLELVLDGSDGWKLPSGGFV